LSTALAVPSEQDERFTAPSSDAEMYQRYWKHVRGLLVKQGVPSVHADDAAQDVFAALIRRKVREKYDPQHTVEHQNGVKRCTFQAYLLGITALYARGIREKHGTNARREKFLFDLPGNDAWAELLTGTWMDDYPSLSEAGLTARLRTWLALQPPAPPGETDLLALFDELACEARKPSKQEKAALAQLPWASVEAVPDSSLALTWDIGGLAVTPEQVHAAVLVLEADKSIMVLGPLQRAGHPLGDAPGKRWYHPFSKEEIKAFPDIAIDPQTHRKPAGHVKIAVLHRLRRMLEEAVPALLDAPDTLPGSDQDTSAPTIESPQVTEVDEQDTPWDRIEAVLWELGASASVVGMCQSWAQKGGMAVLA